MEKSIENEEKSTSNDLDQLDFWNSFEAQQPKNNPSMKPEEDHSTISSINASNLENINQLPKYLLIVDTETTGLNPEEDHCLEIGAILYHVKTRSVLSQHSFLLPVMSNDAEGINKIPAEITNLPQPWQMGLEYLSSLLKSADAIVAHNATFDRQWFGRDQLPMTCKPWICTMEDIIWPKERQLSNRPSVRDLALSYGVPVWNAHRALTDCIYIAEVFNRCDDLEELLIKGLEPRVLMRAQVSYEQRHLAKDAGFRWNNPIKGAWSRRLTERECSELEFEVEVVCTE